MDPLCMQIQPFVHGRRSVWSIPGFPSQPILCRNFKQSEPFQFLAHANEGFIRQALVILPDAGSRRRPFVNPAKQPKLVWQWSRHFPHADEMINQAQFFFSKDSINVGTRKPRVHSTFHRSNPSNQACSQVSKSRFSRRNCSVPGTFGSCRMIGNDGVEQSTQLRISQPQSKMGSSL